MGGTKISVFRRSGLAELGKNAILTKYKNLFIQVLSSEGVFYMIPQPRLYTQLWLMKTLSKLEILVNPMIVPDSYEYHGTFVAIWY